MLQDMHQYFKKSDNSHDSRNTNATGHHQINFSELQNEQNIKNENKLHDQEKYKNNA